MRPSPMRCSWVAAIVLLASCTSRAHSPPRPVRSDVHSEVGVLVVVHDEGSLVIRRLRDGRVLHRLRGPGGAGRSYGGYTDSVRCRTRTDSNGNLVVTHRRSVRVFDLETGRLRSSLSLTRFGTSSICPALAADGWFFVHQPAFHGSGQLLKVGRAGRVVFRAAIPDIGPLVGEIEVDSRTGDAILTSRTHVVAFSPDGRLNWARSHRE